MPCDTQLKPRQTVQERADEVRRAISRIDRLIVDRSAQVIVGPQGAVAFTGISAAERDGITDACIYRRLMVSGSALAKAQIARAEQMSGRSINRAIIGQGVHSHDGGRTWHGKG